MNKIIVVYGDNNVGKTTVINEIYDELINQGATVIKAKRRIGGDFNDFKSVLSFQNKSVAFLSMGDYRKTVDTYVNSYSKYNIFITALNKHFAHISTVWLKNSNIIYKIDKKSAATADNQLVKNKIIMLIKDKD